MSMFEPAPTPKSHLGRYRLLAPSAAVKVSPLCLGAMNFGDSWYGTQLTLHLQLKIADILQERPIG